jgi:glycine/D-amino acid oxidase-like deaminating enzyme
VESSGVPDVIVVGGGIIGVSAAAHLAEAGRQVTLVERAEIAAGASGRNSGVVQHPFDPVLVELHLETVELYRTLEGFAMPAEPAGLLSVTHDVDGVRRLTASIAASHPALRPRFVDPDEMRTVEPTLAPGVAACRLDIGYPVGPAAATRAYAARAERAGVEIRIRRPYGATERRSRESSSTAPGWRPERSLSRPDRGRRRSSTRPAAGDRSSVAGASSFPSRWRPRRATSSRRRRSRSNLVAKATRTRRAGTHSAS